jgi:hypothetical protein
VKIVQLFEARSHPDVNTGNRWKNVVEHFRPYFGREGAYISMVNIEKIGIHPMSGHDTTPTAIYCYPLAEQEIVHQFENNRLPYMTWARYAALLIEKPGLKKLSCNMSETDAEASIAQLDEMMHKIIDPEIWTDVKREMARHERFHSHYGHLYTYTNAAATIASMRLEYLDLEKEGTGDPRDTVHYFSHVLQAEDFVSATRRDDSNRPRVWNTLLRKLGYDAIEDRGTKFIYNIEPFQTGFLSRAGIANYELFRNGRSDVYHHSGDRERGSQHHEIQSANHFINLVLADKIPAKEALTFMNHMMKGEDLPAGDAKYYSYNPAIRLSPAQVKRTFEYVKKAHPKETGQWLARASMFRDGASLGYGVPKTSKRFHSNPVYDILFPD